MRPDIKYWIALSKINGLGPAKFKKIYAVFESMAAAWSAGRGEWQKTNLDEKLIDEILYQRHQINPDEELDKMTREQIEAVTAVDEDYPKL